MMEHLKRWNISFMKFFYLNFIIMKYSLKVIIYCFKSSSNQTTSENLFMSNACVIYAKDIRRALLLNWNKETFYVNIYVPDCEQCLYKVLSESGLYADGKTRISAYTYRYTIKSNI